MARERGARAPACTNGSGRLGLDAEIHEFWDRTARRRRSFAQCASNHSSRGQPPPAGSKTRPRVPATSGFATRSWARRKEILQSAGLAVYDFDDALMWEPRDGVARRLAASRARKCRVAIEHADVVIAGSDVLADWASGYARDVRNDTDVHRTSRLSDQVVIRGERPTANRVARKSVDGDIPA